MQSVRFGTRRPMTIPSEVDLYVTLLLLVFVLLAIICLVVLKKTGHKYFLIEFLSGTEIRCRDMARSFRGVHCGCASRSLGAHDHFPAIATTSRPSTSLARLERTQPSTHLPGTEPIEAFHLERTQRGVVDSKIWVGGLLDNGGWDFLCHH